MAHQHVLMGAESNRARPIVRTIGLRDLKDCLLYTSDAADEL